MENNIEPSPSTSKSGFIDETLDSESDAQAESIDPSCVLTIKNRLVRIQYPGIVKNVDKALQTLGGLSGIEKAVSNKPSKLQLNFHPDNKFNKGCLADCDSNAGLLIKIKIQKSNRRPPQYSYEIIGATVRNFTFNKLLDFQYLPLMANYPEKSSSDVTYIYDSIIPKKLPTLQEMLSKEKVNMPLFLPPVGFSRTEGPKRLPTDKKPINNGNPEHNSSPKNRLFLFSKPEPASLFHKFSDPNVPTKPSDLVLSLTNKRNYDELIQKLKKLFETRPIWTKHAVKFNTSISNDLLKLLLPAVAYYSTTGPWRGTWIRFGYDPRKDPDARKYQNLDYRMPQPMRSNMKIGSKRCFIPKSGPTSLNKLPKEEFSRAKIYSAESIFILRPNMLPPARQMFYQYCDILLPEIQTMLARLPPVPSSTKCDPKKGWLPTSFSEQCREIVNKYIDQQAANVLAQCNENQTEKEPINTINEKMPSNYCSLMIRNVKRGLYRDTNPLNIKLETEPKAQPSTSYDISETDSVTEIIDSTDSEDSLFEESFYQDYDEPTIEFVKTDGDMISEMDPESMDIDIDALEDVKNIIANTQSKTS